MTVITSFRDEYAFLSNFHPAPITVEGITYPTVEHAFAAAKTPDTEVKRYVADIGSPGKVKRFGRKVELPADWDTRRLAVMEDLLRRKFTTHRDLRDQLLATGDATLVEGNTWNDNYWGVCKGSGENHLGRLLMQIRSELAASN